jgi:hypothetical protein
MFICSNFACGGKQAFSYYPDRQMLLIAAPTSGLGNGVYLAQLEPEPTPPIWS